MKIKQLLLLVLKRGFFGGLISGHITLLSLLALLVLNGAAIEAQASAVRVEVPVDVVMIPTKGFDDNDNVSLVIHGSLPNTCYRLTNTEVVHQGGRNSRRFLVRQYAMRRSDDACLGVSQIPDRMRMIVPFTVEKSIGQLSQGVYELSYSQAGTRSQNLQVRTFEVARARHLEVDNMPYASVTQVNTIDVVTTADIARATIAGLLTSACVETAHDFIVERQDDVFVVLPPLQVRNGFLCTLLVRPFIKEITLGQLQPGHYLVHARSNSGAAVNRVFSVVNPTPVSE